MAIRTPLTTLLATALLVVVAAAQQPQTPIFRSGTEIVDLYVTATDKNGRLVPNLAQEDFVILDEEEAQEIVLFENEVRPITVVVMLDTSASMTPSLELLMAGAEQFLIRMLPEDRAKVGAFNDKIQILPSQFIGDRDALIRQLDQLQFGNPTRLYDAVGASIDELQGVEGRKVVLVFTDGADTQHAIGWRDVLDKARAAEVRAGGTRSPRGPTPRPTEARVARAARIPVVSRVEAPRDGARGVGRGHAGARRRSASSSASSFGR